MIRSKLRTLFVKWVFGSEVGSMLENLRHAVLAVQSTRAEQCTLSDRLGRLERVAIVAVGPLDGEEMRKRADPYLDETGVVFCTAMDALVSNVRPIERMTV